MENRVKHIVCNNEKMVSDWSNPLVSIIIPVYNRESLLPDTLQNIIDNKYRPLEVVLVDDGSTDTSLQIIREFKIRNESGNFIIKVYEQDNMGAPVARNLGLKYSKGEYVQFLDSDDLIDLNKFSIQIQLMEKCKADFGLCDFLKIFLKDKSLEYHSNGKKLRKILNAKGSFGCGSPLLRKDLCSKVSWNPNLDRQQDVDFFLKAALLAKRIAYINQPLYFYVNHDNEQISDRYSKFEEIYLLRIKSLISLFKYRYNIIPTILAISHLSYSHLIFLLKIFAYRTIGEQRIKSLLLNR